MWTNVALCENVAVFGLHRLNQRRTLPHPFFCRAGCEADREANCAANCTATCGKHVEMSRGH